MPSVALAVGTVRAVRKLEADQEDLTKLAKKIQVSVAGLYLHPPNHNHAARILGGPRPNWPTSAQVSAACRAMPCQSNGLVQGSSIMDVSCHSSRVSA